MNENNEQYYLETCSKHLHPDNNDRRSRVNCSVLSYPPLADFSYSYHNK